MSATLRGVVSLHKLSAGDRHTYLTRQVAAGDDTNRGHGTLASYYEQKGESPGVWLGSGLDSLGGSVPDFPVVGIVTEAQMTGARAGVAPCRPPFG
ncbi:MAG: hypothetical protein QOG07_4131 [Pseudonocardiales bacterium]|nr:hypothetical protein [Pseudonocardiales bacterium]MDT4982252.1 hypothetical protein [Pseudonocardiales bacterium]